MEINLYFGKVHIHSYQFENISFNENIKEFKEYLKEEYLPPFGELKFMHNGKEIYVKDNLDIFKMNLKSNKKINIYSPLENILYPIKIYILPLNANPINKFNKKSLNYILFKKDIMMYTFNSLLLDINNQLKMYDYTFVKEFYYIKDGNINLMNKEISKNNFEDVIYSLRSNYPQEDGIIIVNSK